MKTLSSLLAAGALAAISSQAFAATPLNVGPFRGVSVEDGGQVILRYGPRPSVTLIEGDLRYSRIWVERRSEDGRLKIDACTNRCPRNYRLVVEVVTPNLSNLAVGSGGEIRAEDGFPLVRKAAVAVDSGGSIDLRRVLIADAAAAVDSGGKVQLNVRDKLMAVVDSGGLITYRGNPRVSQVIDDGGVVRRER